MRVIALGRIGLACALSAVVVEASAFPFPSVAAPAKLMLTPTTMSGCLSRSQTRAAPIVRYRAGLQQGHHLPIAGGLLPSATVAAQAGALDPVYAALAAARGTAGADRRPAPDASTESRDALMMRRPRRCP